MHPVSCSILVKYALRSAVLMLVISAPITSRAQRGASSPTPPESLGGGVTGPRNTSLVPMPSIDMGMGAEESAEMRVRRENVRKLQRKGRMVSSANRLLALTKEFQADLAIHPEMTPENEKRLDDIAKLAHEVKTRMQE